MDPEKLDPRMHNWDISPIRGGSVSLLGVALIIEGYGLCHPHRVVFKKDGNVVYMWDREEETRREFFFGEGTPSREYEGDRFCFSEYCELGRVSDRVPTAEDLADVRLDEDVKRIYRAALEKIINSG